MGYKFPKREIGVVLGGLVHPFLGGMLKDKYDAENRAPQDKANAAALKNLHDATFNKSMNATSGGLMLSNIPQSVSAQRRSPESDRADGRTMFDAQESLLNPNGSGPNINPLSVPKDMNFQRRATPNGWVTPGDMTETQFMPEGGPPQQSMMPQPFARTPQQSPLMNTQGYSQPENRQLQGPPNEATQNVRRAIEQGLWSMQAGQRPMNKNEFNGAPQTRPTAAAVEGYNPLGSIERNNYATQQLGRMDNLTEGQKLQVERLLAQMAPKPKGSSILSPEEAARLGFRPGTLVQQNRDTGASSVVQAPAAAQSPDWKPLYASNGKFIGSRNTKDPDIMRALGAGSAYIGEQYKPPVNRSIAEMISDRGITPPEGTQPIIDSNGRPTGAFEPIVGGPKDPLIIQAKADAALLADRPEVLKKVEPQLKILDRTLRTLRAIRGDDDTQDVVGAYEGMQPLWGTSKLRLNPLSAQGNATAAARIKNLKDIAKSVGFQEVRDGSKTGSGGGNTTEKEWPIFEARITNLDTTQGEGDFDMELLELERMAVDMMSRIIEDYEGTYSDKLSPEIHRQSTLPIGAKLLQNGTALFPDGTIRAWRD